MPLVTLKDVLQPALKGGYAVGGLVTLGWEDMRAYVAAAEAENCPSDPASRSRMSRPYTLARPWAKCSGIWPKAHPCPVVAHLDHGYTLEECKEALESGFTSLMFDGSRKPLSQNIEETAKIAEMAHNAGISCEGEIGFVGYSDGEASAGTDPEEAAQFAR